MITEASARLVSKLTILCFIFTLCQFGSEFKSQSIDPTLPDEEARVLNTVTDKLKLSTTISAYGVCKESSSYTGITCNCNFLNGTICHITAVTLSRRGLTGVIPEEVVNLTYLQKLNLADNQLTGFIPASLGNLSSLYWLDLSNNLLTGSIPESLGNIKFQVLAITRSYGCNKASMSYVALDLPLSNQLEDLVLLHSITHIHQDVFDTWCWYKHKNTEYLG